MSITIEQLEAAVREKLPDADIIVRPYDGENRWRIHGRPDPKSDRILFGDLIRSQAIVLPPDLVIEEARKLATDAILNELARRR